MIGSFPRKRGQQARSRDNLAVETGTHATGVVFEGTRAVGVRYRVNGEERRVHAAREVLLCAGALQSPQLLQLSGVGPRALLDAHGIAPVHALEAPDMQFFISTVSAEARGAAPHPFPGFTFVFYPMRPTSRGHVRIKSADPKAAPAMQPNYLSTDYDRRSMVAGARMARALAATRSLSPYVMEELQPGPAAQSDEQLLDAVRAHGSSGYHPAGTCRMGTDTGAVVDPRLRVHGVQGLRVIDASVMPTLVSGNTNAATIMIAEKGADLVREDALRSGHA